LLPAEPPFFFTFSLLSPDQQPHAMAALAHDDDEAAAQNGQGKKKKKNQKILSSLSLSCCLLSLSLLSCRLFLECAIIIRYDLCRGNLKKYFKKLSSRFFKLLHFARCLLMEFYNLELVNWTSAAAAAALSRCLLLVKRKQSVFLIAHFGRDLYTNTHCCSIDGLKGL